MSNIIALDLITYLSNNQIRQSKIENDSIVFLHLMIHLQILINNHNNIRDLHHYINLNNFSDYYPNDYIIVHGHLINRHLYEFILDLAGQTSREDGYDTDVTDDYS
jgi:hypothetical protein